MATIKTERVCGMGVRVCMVRVGREVWHTAGSATEAARGAGLFSTMPSGDRITAVYSVCWHTTGRNLLAVLC